MSGSKGGKAPGAEPPSSTLPLWTAATALIPLASHRTFEFITLQLAASPWQGFLYHVLPPGVMIGCSLLLWRLCPPLPGQGGTLSPGHPGLAVAAGLLLGTMAAIANLLSMLANPSGSSGTMASVGLGVVGLVAHVALLAPLAEELAFRGVLYRHLRRVLLPINAALLSSLIFAVMHATWGQGVWAMLLGIIAAFSYEQTRSILSPILIHGLFNSVPIGIAVVRSRPGDTGPIWLVLGAVALLFTFAAKSAGEVSSTRGPGVP